MVIYSTALFWYFPTGCRTKNKGSEPGMPCVFPFQYKGKEYLECTTKYYGSTYWCGTTYSVTNNAGWGLCSSSCISAPGNKLIRSCVQGSQIERSTPMCLHTYRTWFYNFQVKQQPHPLRLPLLPH